MELLGAVASKGKGADIENHRKGREWILISEFGHMVKIYQE